MTTSLPWLPGSLEGLLDAGTTLFDRLQAADDHLQHALAVLAVIERTVQRGEPVTPLLAAIVAVRRNGDREHERADGVLRRYRRVR